MLLFIGICFGVWVVSVYKTVMKNESTNDLTVGVSSRSRTPSEFGKPSVLRPEFWRDKPFQTTPWLLPLGIYVWGDGVVLALFWIVLAIVCSIFLNGSWFGLGAAIFWMVRAGGEVVYWLLEQFSQTKRNPPKTLVGYNLIKGEAIWFIYQLVNQCIVVIAAMVAIYFCLQLSVSG